MTDKLTDAELATWADEGPTRARSMARELIERRAADGWAPIAEYRDEMGEVDLWLHIYASPRSYGMEDDFRVVECRRTDDGKWDHFHEGKRKELYSDYITHFRPLPTPPDQPAVEPMTQEERG